MGQKAQFVYNRKKTIEKQTNLSRREFLRSTVLFWVAATFFPIDAASGAYIIHVDQNRCIGCEECVDVCPVEVFEMRKSKAVPVNAEECLGCESCIVVCETRAITMDER